MVCLVFSIRCYAQHLPGALQSCRLTPSDDVVTFLRSVEHAAKKLKEALAPAEPPLYDTLDHVPNPYAVVDVHDGHV